jgi:hypothetical protein
VPGIGIERRGDEDAHGRQRSKRATSTP